ncbi:hypothetical protein C7Y72_03065 [Paraconexibacter algicola]|uniref:Blue (type 1) copper domain-containing protein n=2 Tax=Paraconexibacter algicola TaxID=2133960 RepID=A0A2T4UHI9_9ACTN|nr:hypothetical protein C7Y72_03065 [Paraconexibacter algicola]
MDMTRHARHALLAGAAAAALVPVALASAQDGPPTPTASAAATKTVTMQGVAFSPKTVRISKGGKVRFRWADNGIVHNVTPVGSKRFKLVVNGRSRATASNRTKGTVTTAAITKAGTYTYICTIHAQSEPDGSFAPGSMVGRIIVK